MNRRILKILVPTAALALAGGFGVWSATAGNAADAPAPKPVPSKTAPAPSPSVGRDGQVVQCLTCGWDLPPGYGSPEPSAPAPASAPAAKP